MIFSIQNHLKTGLFALSFLFFDYIEYVVQIPLLFVLGGSFSFISFVISLQRYSLIVVTFCSFLFFFLHNLVATGWLLLSTYSEKALLVYAANAFLMALPILLWHISTKILRAKEYLIILIWIIFEYVHFLWPLSWLWLAFGHSFGQIPEIVQWYEYTGVLGGTLWFLLLGYTLVKLHVFKTSKSFSIAILMALIFAPLLLSKYISSRSNEEELFSSVRVLVAHTNIANDSPKMYSNFERLKFLLDHLKENNIDSVDYILLPEYFFSTPLSLQKIRTCFEINVLQSHLTRYHSPQTHLILGAEIHDDLNKYNSIVELTHNSITAIYNKQKLIPFHERTPNGFEFLRIESVELSNDINSIIPFKTRLHNSYEIMPIPAICYESIYGYHLSNQITSKNEVLQALFFFSNEAFMKQTIGIVQYFNIIKLRAIEVRKPIVRSSNLGYSGFITKKGEVQSMLHEDEFGFIIKDVHFNAKRTFYSKNPDLLGLICLTLFSFEIIRLSFEKFKNNNKTTNLIATFYNRK